VKSFISDAWLFGIPGVVFLWMLLGVGLWLLLQRTVFGKSLYAVGGSYRVALFSGVQVQRIIVLTYVLSGLLAAFAGFVILGYTSSVFLTLGESYTLPSIAAVVVGGTLISGGVGGYSGTIAGAILLTLVQSLLIALGLPEFGRQIIYGVILLILISAYGRGRRAHH
jgi:ribose transport system permease protein